MYLRSVLLKMIYYGTLLHVCTLEIQDTEIVNKAYENILRSISVNSVLEGYLKTYMSIINEVLVLKEASSFHRINFIFIIEFV